MTETYFFDTYAIFEVIFGNPKYKSFFDKNFITTVFNIAELNYGLKKDFSKETADIYVDRYWDFLVQVTSNDIKTAMTFKSKNKKLSIPDAVGYTVAKRLGVKFLTGDEDFKDMNNVEFVKK